MPNYIKNAMVSRSRKNLRDALTSDAAAVKQASLNQAVPARIGGNAGGLIGSMGRGGSSAVLYGGYSSSGGNGGNSNYGSNGVNGSNSNYGSAGTQNVPASQGGSGGSENSYYDKGSFEDYYSSLINTLQHYGAALDLPSLDSIYAQLEAFLRPATDAAIESRQEYGENTLAELDADAYSRGMGSSTYLSSIKAREYNAIARDIAKLESNYNAELAKYMYDASMEFTKIRTQLMEIELQHRYAMEQLRYRNQISSSGGGHDGENTKQDTGSSGESYYNKYYAYLIGLSEQERWDFVNAKKGMWLNMREAAKSALTAEEYDLLMREIIHSLSVGNGNGGGHANSGGSGRSGSHGAHGHSSNVHVYN